MSRHQLKPQPTAQERMERKRQAKEQPKVDYYLAGKVKKLAYDYGQIPEEHRGQVQQVAVEIKKRQRQASIDLLEIGACLNEVKELLPHGKFAEWIEVEFGYGTRMAQEFMAVARRFDPNEAKNEDLAARVFAALQSDKSAFNAYLEPTVIRMLAAKSVPDSAIEEVLAAASVQDEPVSVAQTKAIISEHKATLPPKPPSVPSKPKQLPGPVAEPDADAIEAEYTVVTEPLTFADWLASMPGDLSLREQMAILSLAKTTALRALGGHPKLHNAVYGALPTWSHLIHEIEKRLKTDE